MFEKDSKFLGMLFGLINLALEMSFQLWKLVFSYKNTFLKL